MRKARIAGVAAAGVALFGIAFGVGFSQTRGRSGSQDVGVAGSPGTAAPPGPSAAAGTSAVTAATAATAPCSLSVGSGPAQSVPVNSVCSSAGAPHFDTPQQAMAYLAAAWNAQDVQEIDYVTNAAGRQQMDAMAPEMPNLQFESCTADPAGDYTCYFQHDIHPSTSSTTYPNPAGYPPGEAVFTVAPATGPGWYLTFVVHCG